MIPRGIRNHNPGNIRKGKTVWQGAAKAQPDAAFVSFETPQMGLRALMKTLLTYQRKHELEHIRAMILRWAPPVENDTEAYIAQVASRVGAGPLDYIDLDIPENLIRMSQAIVRHENGKCPDPTLPWWYAEETYEEAAAMALGRPIEAIV